MTAGATFTGLVDLAAGDFGGRALGASDDFFAECTALTDPGAAVFVPGKFTERGKWMDGWESRRRRGPGHDTCILALGARGKVLGFDIDTSHFHGNQPAFASVDGVVAAQGSSYDSLANANWQPLLEAVRLRPNAHNLCVASASETVTHLRLNIFPDGGVARLRAYGVVQSDFSVRDCDADQLAHVAPEAVDLAALKNGALVLACSDAHFGSEQQLLLPGRSPNMGGGWETRRRRGPGHDWAIVRLAAHGIVNLLEVDTQHFKGNYPDRCSVEAIFAPGLALPALVDEPGWTPLLAPVKLQPDTRHFFPIESQPARSVSHLRLTTFPDGGISRLRAWGSVQHA
jgi:allantoicase